MPVLDFQNQQIKQKQNKNIVRLQRIIFVVKKIINQTIEDDKWIKILVWFGLIHYSAFSAAKAM